jgi:hypothetical protein
MPRFPFLWMPGNRRRQLRGAIPRPRPSIDEGASVPHGICRCECERSPDCNAKDQFMTPKDHKRLMKLARKAMQKGNSLVANRWLRTAGLAQKLPEPEPPRGGSESAYVETPETQAAREALLRRLDALIAGWERDMSEEEIARSRARAAADYAADCAAFGLPLPPKSS